MTNLPMITLQSYSIADPALTDCYFPFKDDGSGNRTGYVTEVRLDKYVLIMQADAAYRMAQHYKNMEAAI